MLSYWWVGVLVAAFFYWHIAALVRGREPGGMPWWISLAIAMHLAGLLATALWVLWCAGVSIANSLRW